MDTLLTIAFYLTVIVHSGFVLFVLAGGVIFLNFPKVRVAHLVMALYGFTIAVLQFLCPLTPLENFLRGRLGWPQYQGGFVQYYSQRILPFKVENVLFVVVAVGTFVLTLALFFFYKPVWRVRR